MSRTRKTAFDLDGVFIPDCDRIPNLGDVENFYRLTQFMRPIFRPQGEWSIITARPKSFKSLTVAWVEKYFASNPPTAIYHDAVLETPAEYKAKVLNENGFTFFVESERSIVDELRLLSPSCTIVHFDQYIAKNCRADSL